ncbi:hypothetical protein BKA82DRAFT_2364545 [Pisolithus tinctorius]|nr:hypothetical protein BKA82DRAFT_2364545 [Pisolithus tinctorius]
MAFNTPIRSLCHLLAISLTLSNPHLGLKMLFCAVTVWCIIKRLSARENHWSESGNFLQFLVVLLHSSFLFPVICPLSFTLYSGSPMVAARFFRSHAPVIFPDSVALHTGDPLPF